MIEYTELRQISITFRRLSSNLLRSGYNDADVSLARLMKYIENTEFIHNKLHTVVDDIVFNFKDCFRIDETGWNSIVIPEDEAEHLKAQYDYINYILNTDKKTVCGEAMGYMHSSGSYDEIIRKFLDTAFKPLIDFINDTITSEIMNCESILQKERYTINNTIYGTMNYAERGNISSINTTAINDTKELLETIIVSLDNLNSIPIEEIENIRDDLESISEQMNVPIPKKSRVQKCVERVKTFTDKFSMELAVSTAKDAVTSADWSSLIQQLQQWVSLL